MLGCAHEQKAHGVWLIGVANKMQFLRRSWALPNDSKYNMKQVLRRSRPIRCAYESLRRRDLAIFVLTTQINRLLYPLLRMRARGNKSLSHMTL
jgi:hypothetical protein